MPVLDDAFKFTHPTHFEPDTLPIHVDPRSTTVPSPRLETIHATTVPHPSFILHHLRLSYRLRLYRQPTVLVTSAAVIDKAFNQELMQINCLTADSTTMPAPTSVVPSGGIYAPPPLPPAMTSQSRRNDVTLLRVKRTHGDITPDAVLVRVKRRRVDVALQGLSLQNTCPVNTVVFRRVRRAIPTNTYEFSSLSSSSSMLAPHDASMTTVSSTTARVVDVDSTLLRNGMSENKEDGKLDGNDISRDVNERREWSDELQLTNESRTMGENDNGGHMEIEMTPFDVFAPEDVPASELAGLGWATERTAQGVVDRVAFLDDGDVPELRVVGDEEDESDVVDESDLDGQTVDYPSTPGGSDEEEGREDEDEDEARGLSLRRDFAFGLGGDDDSEGEDDEASSSDGRSDGQEWERYEGFGRDDDGYDSEI